MNQTYIVDLNPDLNKQEEYESEGKNIAEVLVYDTLKDVYGNEYIVQLGMTPEAMIGFGSALIRKAMASRGKCEDPKIDVEPITPIHNSEPYSEMGIFLSPRSAKLQIFLEEESVNLTKIINQLEKKN